MRLYTLNKAFGKKVLKNSLNDVSKLYLKKTIYCL